MPPTSLHAIQAHLYDSFLKGETADVNLVVSGSGLAPPGSQSKDSDGATRGGWRSLYQLHRVVLIQAGYFRSLFTAGFAEESRVYSPSPRLQSSSNRGNTPLPTSSKRARASSYADLDVNLHFADPNITRAAFEVCLGRLYGGGPSLYLPDDLQTTLAHPLTSSFPYPPSSLFPNVSIPLAPSSSTSSAVPDGHHPATPRFLLSLLATATYLSMPEVASEALGLIMLSIGPWTVVRFLRFAIGHGIGLDLDPNPEEASEANSNSDIRMAVGLQHVAEVLPVSVEMLDRSPLASHEVTLDSLVPAIEPMATSRTSSMRTNSSKLTGTISRHARPPLPDEFAGSRKSCSQAKRSNDTGDPTTRRCADAVITASTASLRHRPEDDPPSSSSTPSNDDDDDERIVNHGFYFYGAVGNQIGESCACWLARWAGDMLEYEEAIYALRISPASTVTTLANIYRDDNIGNLAMEALRPLERLRIGGAASVKGKGKGKGKREDTVGYTVPSAAQAQRPYERKDGDLVIWGHGGLSMHWIRGIISSDSFFVAAEMERYRFAVRVCRLRKLMGCGDEDEEWELLFRNGIYYSHMSFDDLRELENDGYVPPEVLTSAHWTHSALGYSIMSTGPSHHHGSSSITSCKATGSTPSTTTAAPASNAEESSYASTGSNSNANSTRKLHLTHTTAEIAASMADTNPKRATRAIRKKFFPVFADGSARFGDYLASSSATPAPPDYSGSTMLFPPIISNSGDLGGDGGASAVGAGNAGNAGKDGTTTHPGKKPASENTFFGLASSRRMASEVAQEDPTGNALWTEYEPFRFSVEWWGAENLKDKARLHSRTITYAGSLYNVYIQIMRKNGMQLGIYLHRQSTVDPLPAASVSPIKRSLSPYRTSPMMLVHTPRARAISEFSPMGAGGGGGSDLDIPNPIAVQISTRVSRLTGAVSSSPPTPTSVSVTLPHAHYHTAGSRDTSPGHPTVKPSTSSPSTATATSLGGSSISTTYTTYFRSSPPPGGPGGSLLGGSGLGATPATSVNSNTWSSHSYRDPRTTVRAYFSIVSPSASGTSMTVFKSVPDDFAIHGSWGWRSSACVEIPLPERASREAVIAKDTDESGVAAAQQWLCELKSVRSTIIIGVV